ncbi:MAG TPA: mucin desulfatase, partial [Akkermansia sp.]|nr:mucin desulfatase [Akkermansia sp.]
DLDTVMPGSVLYDFGDMVRTMTSPTAEDEEDPDKTFMRMPMFEAVVKGYLETARDFITPQEVSKPAFSGLLITLETGIRFLTDYLEGDVYFKTKKERHNLYRARTQLRLAESMEEQMPEMEEYVRKCFQTVNG